jgi:cytochrome P450
VTTRRPERESGAGCPIHFDPLAPDQRESPYAVLAQARREAPVFFAQELGFWVVTRYDDVLAVLKDHATFSSVDALRSSSDPLPPEVQAVLADAWPEMPVVIDTDPPLHSRIRGLVTRAFTPKRVVEMEPHIVTAATDLIDGFASSGRGDIIEQFAWPLPLHVIGDLLGLPRSDLPQIHEWSNDWLALFQPIDSLERQMELARSAVALQRYFYDALEDRTRNPRDDLMSALLDARAASDRPLSMVEVMGVPFDLVVAGHVTVTRAIGSALALLLDHPPYLGELQASHELVSGVIEEVLRMESPAQGLFRKTTRAVELGGAELPQGARLMVHFASANRDEQQFTNPDAFDPRRAELGRHLAFGKGIHFCIGAPLARLELRLALPMLLEGLPGLRRDPESRAERERIFFARGFEKLPLVWDPPTR